MDIVLEGDLGDQCVVEMDKVFDLGGPVAADIEAEAVTEPDHVGVALALDDTHLTWPRHLAYSRFEKDSQGVVGVLVVAVASHH